MNILFDIETTGTVPWEDKIICIGTVKEKTGEPKMFYDPREENVVRSFIEWHEKENIDTFIGYSISFDTRFILAKSLKHAIEAKKFFQSKFVDIMSILKNPVQSLECFGRPGKFNEWLNYLFNETKHLSGRQVPTLHENGEIKRIIRYNQDELSKMLKMWKLIKHTLGSDFYEKL